jgi:hypothetical protein
MMQLPLLATALNFTSALDYWLDCKHHTVAVTASYNSCKYIHIRSYIKVAARAHLSISCVYFAGATLLLLLILLLRPGSDLRVDVTICSKLSSFDGSVSVISHDK